MKAIQVPLLVSVLAFAVAACTLTPPATPGFLESGLAVSIRTADGLAGVARRNGLLILVRTASDGGLTEGTQMADRAGVATVGMLTDTDDVSGHRYHTWLFGNAPPGATRFVSGRGGAGGDVSNGVFVLLLPDMNMSANELEWRFVGENGATVLEGHGIAS